jgi:CheY-like chemotaxis protein
MIARVLEEEGYNVLQACDGLAALDVFSAGADVQLVVTDIVMPRMDGIELATALAAAANPVPILFTSGFSQSPSELPGPLLQKPFRSDTLIAEVQRLLQPPHRHG